MVSPASGTRPPGTRSNRRSSSRAILGRTARTRPVRPRRERPAWGRSTHRGRADRLGRRRRAAPRSRIASRHAGRGDRLDPRWPESHHGEAGREAPRLGRGDGTWVRLAAPGDGSDVLGGLAGRSSLRLRDRRRGHPPVGHVLARTDRANLQARRRASPPSRSTPTAGSWRSGGTTAPFDSGRCPTRRPSVSPFGSTTPCSP